MLNSSGHPDGAGAAGNSASPSLTNADSQAAQWWLRRQEGLTAEDASLFREWLEADPAHAAALRAVEETAQALDALPGNATGALVGIARASVRPGHALPAPLSSTTRNKGLPDSVPRRRLAGQLAQAALATVMLAVAGTGGWALVDHLHAQPVFVHNYVTAPGQLIKASLPDGSRIELDTATRLEVALYRDRREVRLTGGQAHFSVAPDPAKPFEVAAANTLVTVVGTRFAVRHVGARVRVAVEEGSVRMTQRDARGQTRVAAADAGLLLGAGDVAHADHAGHPSAVGRVGAESVAVWRHGRVVFDNTPLAEAVAEFGRYGYDGVVIRDAGVAAMRITGSFNVTEFAGFAAALPKVLPVRLSRHSGQTEIVRR